MVKKLMAIGVLRKVSKSNIPVPVPKVQEKVHRAEAAPVRVVSIQKPSRIPTSKPHPTAIETPTPAMIPRPAPSSLPGEAASASRPAAVSNEHKKRKLDHDPPQPREEQLTVREMHSEMKEMCQNLEDKMNLIIRKMGRMQVAIEELAEASKPRDGLGLRIDFKFSPIKTLEELHTFNALLKSDEAYRTKVISWLHANITRAEVNNRLHDTIDLLFERKFFATMNWSGISRVSGKDRIGLSKFSLVLDIFKEIGSTDKLVVGNDYLVKFLQTKLRHANERLNLDEFKVTSCHIRRSDS